MRALCFALLCCGLVRGACPVPYDGTPCIQDYPTAPTVKTLKSGTLECTVWGQSPTAGFVQIACCNTTCALRYNGPLIVNTVLDLRLPSSYGGTFVPSAGVVSWVLAPQAGSPGKMAVSLVVMEYPTGIPVAQLGLIL